ncbi:MAG: protein kinase [Bacteroidota bacterium]
MIGQTVSHYKILEKLGEGGMGVVYKAQDTKLDRLVALKFLPEHVSVGSADLERFTQEAKAAAGLNHPNICTIHGIEEADNKNFIVMEFVDGQMLQEKKSALSLKQALDIGIQIAEGLSAAHEKGIVHRDIKPENIMIRKDGRVQIMDFGLAKLRGASRLTKEGSTVGTAGYMSPEQVQGQETDHRSDIFSLGVLLYEMLSGQPPFKGMHETAIAYEVVNVDSPPMSTLKPEISPELDTIVLECLEKDINERAQSAKQVAIDLNRFKRTSSRSRMSRTMPARMIPGTSQPAQLGQSFGLSFFWRNLPWVITAVVILCTLGWILLFRQEDGSDQAVNRMNISAINSPSQLILHSDVPCLSISPNGHLLVYTLSEAGSSQLYIRSLDSYEVHPIRGTTNGTSPFFSPDGQWIGFVADGRIKKVPAAGGTVETLCDAQGFRGAAWGFDNRIYFSPGFSSGLMSVSAMGGEPIVFSTLDSARGERTHRWPQVLPGGKWILFTVGNQNNPNSYSDAVFMVQSVETGERRELNVRGEMAQYVEPGYLIVARNGSLLAAPFSLDDFRTTKSLANVIDGISGDPGSGVLDFSISQDGQLLYLPGTLNHDLTLVWVTREGIVTPLRLQPQPFNTPRFSPDGTKLAVSLGIVAGDNDIWIYDLKKETFNRLTFSKTVSTPIWSVDGSKLYYASSVPQGIMVQPADGSSQGLLVLESTLPSFPVSLSPNGKQLSISPLGGSGIQVMDLQKGSEPASLISSTLYVYGGTFSPDGRYIAYGSNETGVLEIFVSTFPDLKGKWQVSLGGGITPAWAPGGKEIYYVSTVGKMMAVAIKTSPVFSAGPPQELFDASQMSFPNNPVTNYDISPDGKRFIMIQNTKTSARTSSFSYVQNWTWELKQKVGGGGK